MVLDAIITDPSQNESKVVDVRQIDFFEEAFKVIGNKISGCDSGPSKKNEVEKAP